MGTNSDIRIRQRRRRRAKRRKQIRTIVSALLLLIIIFILIACVKGIFSKNANFRDFSAEIIMNLPEPKPKTTDILESLPDNNGKKVCYLTFDDGPTTSVTPAILDILNRYNAKATFFMTGALMDTNTEIAKRVHAEGHTLANHSWRHNYSYLYDSEENFIQELTDTHDKICEITGRANYPKIFRFPGGSYDSGSYGSVKQNYKHTLKDMGYRYVDWNALSGDAEGQNPTVDQLYSRTVKTTKDKEDVVILMHDSATKKVNIEVLPRILDYLISEGYAFSTLDKAP